MCKSRRLRNSVMGVLLVLFGTACLWAETPGRYVLRMMRDKNGNFPKPAYANRSAKSAELTAGGETLQTTAKSAADSSDIRNVGSVLPAALAGDDLLRMVPAESLFCVRVNNLDFTLNQTDQFLSGVLPMPMMVSMMVRGQFARILGSPQLNGVNTGGNFAAFAAIMPGKAAETESIPEVFFGGLVPVTDYKEFISGNPNCGQPDHNGVSTIIVTGPNAGQPPEKTASDTDGDKPIMLLTQAGNYALISSPDSYDQLVTMAKSISAASGGLGSTLDADQLEQAMAEPIWAYGNVQVASRTFGPVVFDKLEEMKAMMENIKASGQDSMRPPAAVMDIYTSILETLMKETKSLSVTVNPKPNVLYTTNTISAVPGTSMADMFTADSSVKEENKLLAYLEDGAAMNFSGELTGKLNAKAMNFLAAILSKNMAAEDVEKIKALAVETAAVFSGNEAMTFSVDTKSKSPFAIKYVAEVKDADKLNKVIDDAVEMLNTPGIADFHKSLGMELNYTVKRAVDSYKGISIDSARLVAKSTEPNSPPGQMIDAMYGEGLDYRWAVVDGLCVYAIGGDVDLAIRELIDHVKAGGPKQMATEIKAALELLPQTAKADFIATYNYLRLFKMIPAMLQDLGPMPVTLPQIDIPTTSNINLAGSINNGKMVVDIALPKQHLTEIMTAVQMMQQQMMQKMMQEQPSPSGRTHL